MYSRKSFGTQKYDCVMKTKEIFNSLPLTKSSVTTGFYYWSSQRSYHQELSKVFIFFVPLLHFIFQCCCRHYSNYLSIPSKPLGLWNVLYQPFHAFLWDTDISILMNPFHTKNILSISGWLLIRFSSALVFFSFQLLISIWMVTAGPPKLVDMRSFNKAPAVSYHHLN